VGLVRCTEMEPTDAEKLKAHRAQLFLYVVMLLLIVAPVFIYLAQHSR
jgi:hypothetical protein